ncbi:YbjN domain-containing protein [Streptomyces physcomitrii]|uniref:YbjN domain-containing protein n=1 Tax=Streptomyces physcomitrii TaxID=2724184 RepID=A0ABX1HBK0_9ACTN|nr:YbjN domain-containing protein [Streptomyces physcomitrii]NKI44695.1 YbjN domain-containing protein [Streptomyces physcomitrii]
MAEKTAGKTAGNTSEAEQAQVIEQVLTEADLEWESPEPGSYVVKLPGTRKLSTTVSLRLGRHSLSLNAFVIRHPDENEAGVHRWLLERNLKLYGVSYAVDKLGDIYLVGKLPRAAVTPEEIDRLLGSVLEAADGSFNTLLELGFASAIRREYEWRVSRGESTRNLDAFAQLLEKSGTAQEAGGPEDPS